MDTSNPIDSTGSYFDLVKPISIPNITSFHHEPDIDGILPDQDTVDKDVLPEYLQSFHDSGISSARLKRFNWLHPRNYSGDGSLSDDYALSAYGTSVSSPRGEAWEIVDRGPRKSIDELWDEVFEYQQRIKLLEEVHQAQAAAAAQRQYPDLDQIECSQERLQRQVRGGGGEDTSDRVWPEYGDGSETCYTPCSSTMSGSGLSTVAPSLVLFATKTMATLGQTPMKITSGTLTQIDRTTVYASRKGVRSDRGSALHLLHSTFGAFA